MTVAAAAVEIPAPGEVRRRPYRVAELAERWDIDVSTVYRMIYAGVLHAERHAIARLGAAHGGVGGLVSRAGQLRQGTGFSPAECVAAAAMELINRGGGRPKLASWWRAGP